jgi:hypothetical protein
MWDVAKVVTFTLNPMVITSVMNQSHGHSLLLDVLTTTITQIVNLQSKMVYMF